ncbi:MAG: hypothetical protein CR967_03335 [Proteobacteria bacterium]|nr:MAG: hypothetical protein CR967_03335 [Pseudomonadota bacterium]
MGDEFLEDSEFVKLMGSHIGDVLGLLLERDEDFFILVNLQGVSFDPELPSEIAKSFEPIISFSISNYAKESAELNGNIFSFETGFGSENIGSVVSVDLGKILQISIKDAVLLVNTSIPGEDEDKDEDKMEEDQEESLNKSMEAMLSNPENKKFLK